MPAETPTAPPIRGASSKAVAVIDDDRAVRESLTELLAALGFLVTAVGLPVITVIALAKVGGAMDALSSPIGKVAGGILAAGTSSFFRTLQSRKLPFLMSQYQHPLSPSWTIEPFAQT